eukprot:TRINITY_DN15004_c0_g1_i4.p1 TRINITY_DN15004_c0_g1~~TRINITY_DN15004_c0_g1_i4.p1  ORF type:complete len:684 (-),score=125.56 TRINITY_DN15004_c0_g1_i4:124-2175(-)
MAAPASAASGVGSGAPSPLTVLDFDPRETDGEAVARTRRLLTRVLTSAGPEGLARALHVSASRASQLKHRVGCVTCRSRLDGLAATLTATAEGTSASTNSKAEEASSSWSASAKTNACELSASGSSSSALALPAPGASGEGPSPLTHWLCGDAGLGLSPAPKALRDLNSLAAFLVTFGTCTPGDKGEELFDESGRRGGRSSGVLRCAHHAPRAVARAAAVAVVAAATGGPSALPELKDCTPSENRRERDRYVAVLRGGTSDLEWRQLGTIDVDNAYCDLFAWLGDRGLCSSCVDAVTAALLEVRRVVSGATTCTCTRCLERRCCEKAAIVDAPPVLSRAKGGVPDVVRVQGRLRAICGVYRREPLPFNDRPVYKKERTEAYLLYTNLKDWMVSGRPDAGGSRCEGWAYVTDNAEAPDEVVGVWKVSGPRGWEEDRSLCVTAFDELPEGFRAGLGVDDGSAIARHLTTNDRGVLLVPLLDPEVLQEVLWAPDEPPPGRTRTGACAHVLDAPAAQRELRCWLRWLLRERLEAQRRRVLAQAQVGSSLCRLFACAALQQLEQAADLPLGPELSKEKKADKKGQKKKLARVAQAREVEALEDHAEAVAESPAAAAAAAGLSATASAWSSKASTSRAWATRASFFFWPFLSAFFSLLNSGPKGRSAACSNCCKAAQAKSLHSEEPTCA